MKEILIFDLKGPLAHFRKYFTNSSSLSYSFPPRTVIIGLVAGLLGEERDTYYTKFNDSHCKVAVSLKVPVRKIMQTMNYINAKNYSIDALLKDNPNFEHSQIPLEIVCPIEEREICYRIYFYHTDDQNTLKTYEKLKTRLSNKAFVYPPYLGITEFLGEIECVSSEGKISKLPDCSKVRIHSVCRKRAILDRGLMFEDAGAQYLIEKMPADFSDEREVTRYEEYVFERTGKNIVASLKEPAYQVLYNDCAENIVFM